MKNDKGQSYKNYNLFKLIKTKINCLKMDVYKLCEKD